MNGDLLRSLDFDKAYPPTPACVSDSIEAAHKIILSKKKHAGFHKRIALGFCCLAIVVLFVGILGRERPKVTDTVSSDLVVSGKVINICYASSEDEFYHLDKTCKQAKGNIVAIPLITAKEFGKAACLTCKNEH